MSTMNPILDCPVCCDGFTTQTRKRITCPFCEYTACQQCQRRYLLQTAQEPHCMNCMHAWTEEMLRTEFAIAWIHGPYKRHREQCLFERERALLPETQPLVSNYRLASSLRNNVAKAEDRLSELKREIHQLYRQIASDKNVIFQCEYNGYRGYNNGIVKPNSDPRKQMFPCPVEECRGYLDGLTMVCGTCEAKACSKCCMLLDSPDIQHQEDQDQDAHVCDESMVQNFDAIKKQTRPCPKCAAPTFRIDGCKQMFCTQCQTPWDWATGNIIRGVIHNPHYFEWLRTQSEDGTIPRQPGDTPDNGEGGCREGIPTGWTLSRALTREFRERYPNATHYDDIPDTETRVSVNFWEGRKSVMMNFCRTILHVHNIVLDQLQDTRDNSDLRLKYLLKHIDEQQLKVALQRRDKKKKKNEELRNIYDMVCTVGGDLLWAYIDGEKTMHKVVKDIEFLKQYANKHLRQVGGRYQMSVEMF